MAILDPSRLETGKMNHLMRKGVILGTSNLLERGNFGDIYL